jgi:deazaflavin-dependent oxidoreductase (nitroreductase family)
MTASVRARVVTTHVDGGKSRDRRPGRALRWLLRLPVRLYRWRLGWLLGHRFLLLVHVGRRTGRIHETVLEVVQYDRTSGVAVVMSGFGRRADWYQNLRHRPALRVVIGRTTFVPSHRDLTQEAAISVMANYERRNRLAAPIVRMVLSRLTGWSYDGSEAARRRLVSQCPLVAFRPAISETVSQRPAAHSG